MNQKVFSVNWLYRKSDGLLYGYINKPGVRLEGSFLQTHYTVKGAGGEKGILIKEKNNDLSFIEINKLMHTSELFKEGGV